MILPALTEAMSPFFRPIKYSLFPPLGPGHAGRLPGRGRRGLAPGRARRAPRPRRRAGPRGDPGLHHLRPPRLPPGRPLPGEGRVRRARAACTSPRCPTRRPAHADSIFLGPGRGHLAAVPRRLPRRAAAARLSLARADARRPAAHPPRPDQAPPLPRPQLHRRLARLPAHLRLLLQGGLLRGREGLLHPARGRGPGRDRAPARAATSTSSTTTCSATSASPPRSSTGCGAWGASGRPRAR